MNVSILPYSSSAFQPETNDVLDHDHDANEMLDVEQDIFASVFSSFDGEDDVSSLLMTDVVSHVQQETAKVMSPAPSNTHFAAAVVSPTSSCLQLYNFEQAVATTDDFDPTPLADMMNYIPNSCSAISAESFHDMSTQVFTSQGKKRVVSPVQHQKVKNSRPTKKRRVAASSTSTASSKRSSRSSVEKDNSDSLEQTRQRNREHARKSRLRKKAFTTCLQQSFEELKAENEKLRAHVVKALGAQKTESLVQERQPVPVVEQFIASLKQPENLVVDDSTLQFLQGLLRNDAIMKSSPAPANKKSDEELVGSFFMIA
jgi:hypothetical protein